LRKPVDPCNPESCCSNSCSGQSQNKNETGFLSLQKKLFLLKLVITGTHIIDEICDGESPMARTAFHWYLKRKKYRAAPPTLKEFCKQLPINIISTGTPRVLDQLNHLDSFTKGNNYTPLKQIILRLLPQFQKRFFITRSERLIPFSSSLF
jgi:hypothetical protein